EGTVSKVRMDATMTQNVVTYPVEINADNSDGKLRPYLTASASFEVAKHDNVLMVPNAALRWSPSTEQIAPEARAKESVAGGRGKKRDGAPGADDASGADAAAGAATRPARAPTTRKSAPRTP